MNNWGFWKTTDEQAQAILSGDITARNKWFFDNNKLLCQMACNFLQKNKALGFTPLVEVDDLVNQVYLDMPYLCWDNGKALSCYIKMRSFKWCEFGGFSFLRESGSKFLDRRPDLSLDTPINSDADSELFLLDIIATAPDIMQEYDKMTAIDNTELVKKIVGDYLSPQQRKFINYLIDGYKPSVIAERMGLKQWGSVASRIRSKLKAHYLDIESVLSIIA